MNTYIVSVPYSQSVSPNNYIIIYLSIKCKIEQLSWGLFGLNYRMALDYFRSTAAMLLLLRLLTEYIYSIWYRVVYYITIPFFFLSSLVTKQKLLSFPLPYILYFLCFCTMYNSFIPVLNALSRGFSKNYSCDKRVGLLLFIHFDCRWDLNKFFKNTHNTRWKKAPFIISLKSPIIIAQKGCDSFVGGCSLKGWTGT